MSIYVFRLIVSTPPLDLAPVNPTLCYSYLTLDHLLTHVSIFNIIAIGIDRFLSIEDPMRYRAKRTSIKVKKVIVYVWLGCLIFWFAVVFVWPGVVKGFTYEQDYCTPFYETTPFGSILAALVYFWIPTPILFGLYVKLYQTSARMKQSMQANVVIAQPKIQVNHERRPTLSSVNLSSETKTGPNVVAKTAAAAAVELSGATIFVIANERAEDNIKSVFGNELNCSAMQGRLNLSSPVAIRRAPLSPLQKRVHKKLSCNGCSGERKASNSSSATSTRKISSMIDTVASMAEAQNKKAFKAFTFILGKFNIIGQP